MSGRHWLTNIRVTVKSPTHAPQTQKQGPSIKGLSSTPVAKANFARKNWSQTLFLETWRNHDEIHIEMACKKKTWRYVISCYILDSSSFTALRKKFHQLGHTCKNISPASHENLVPARQRLTALLHPECYQHYLLMVWTLIHHRIVFPLSI